MVFTQLDWLALVAHFLSLSLFSVGGVIVAVPEMHRFLVDERHWITDSQFTGSIALAQAAPGPNVLFVALLGWNVGLNVSDAVFPGSHWGSAALGLGLAMFGILAPSTMLTYFAGRWAHLNRERVTVRAFKNGMAPIVTALMLASAWLITAANGQSWANWPIYLLTAAGTVVVWKTRIHLLWLLTAGALLGAVGFV